MGSLQAIGPECSAYPANPGKPPALSSEGLCSRAVNTEAAGKGKLPGASPLEPNSALLGLGERGNERIALSTPDG